MDYSKISCKTMDLFLENVAKEWSRNITKKVACIPRKPKCAVKTPDLASILNLGTKQPKRLFSCLRNGTDTQITNNMTGTRYFASGGLKSRNVEVLPLVKELRADGTHSSVSLETFNSLLGRVSNKQMNPILKQANGIGTEVEIDELRYFRPDAPQIAGGNLITRINPNGRFNSMTINEADKMFIG